MRTVSLACVVNSAAYSTPPPYDEIEADLDPQAARDATPAARTPGPRKSTRLEIAEAVRRLLTEHLVREHRGRLHAKGTLAQVIALRELLQPSGRSLRSLASEIGVTHALLSKCALRLADELHLPARWQRPERRAADAARQRAVAAGQHTPTPKWERRRLVLARRQREAA